MIVDFIQLKSNIKFFFFFLWNLSLTIFMVIVTMQIRTVKTLFLGGWWNFSLKKFMAIITTKTGMVKAFFFFFLGGDFSLTIFMAIIRVLEIQFNSILSSQKTTLSIIPYHFTTHPTPHLLFSYTIY